MLSLCLLILTFLFLKYLKNKHHIAQILYSQFDPLVLRERGHATGLDLLNLNYTEK